MHAWMKGCRAVALLFASSSKFSLPKQLTGMTRTRASLKRNASSSGGGGDSIRASEMPLARIKEESAVTPNKKVKAAKSTTPRTKKSKAAKTSSIISPSAAVAVPWYHVFTKGDEEYNRYMATEWGAEKRGDQALYEKICLEGAQSGLSWQTILRKREAYRRTFFNFDPHKVAAMTPDDVQRILDSPKSKDAPHETIVRHRGKIEATINNAKCVLQMQKEAGGNDDMALDQFLWSFVNDKPILNRWGAKFNPHNYDSLKECPSQTLESQAMSQALKKKGWKFVGPTTCYALMQSCGMVIDHPISSPEWEAARQRLLTRPGGFQDPQG